MDDEKKVSEGSENAENGAEYEERVIGEAARLIGCSPEDIQAALSAGEIPRRGEILDLDRAVALARARESVEELGASGLIRRRIVEHLLFADGNELAGMLRAVQARRPAAGREASHTVQDAAEELDD